MKWGRYRAVYEKLKFVTQFKRSLSYISYRNSKRTKAAKVLNNSLHIGGLTVSSAVK